MGLVTGRRMIIAGVGSGCGKTTAVCGILYGLQKWGWKAAAWKSGPDYIDPMFHKKVCGTGGNLDLFFSGRDRVCALLSEQAQQSDIAVIEGAMGYYDGIGMTEEASCFALAEATGTPVVLTVNPRGMGNSVCALLQGFLHFKKESRIKGILFNQITARQYERLRPAIEDMGLQAVGYFPVQREFTLESRHLGLVTAAEVDGFDTMLEKLYETIAHTIDWEGLLQLSEKTWPVKFKDSPGFPGDLCADRPGTAMAEEAPETDREAVTIGIARDEAFGFLYEDNLRYLEKRGCQLVFFSPLRDRELPAMDGMILCGGYPELYLPELSENKKMRLAVREKIMSGLPCIAECGGFLYLQKSMTDTVNRTYDMTGVFPGQVFRRQRLERFGYINCTVEEGHLFGREQMKFRAHEFHYYDCDSRGSALMAEKASGEEKWMTGIVNQNLYAGFPHIYFYGNEQFAEGFLERAARYRDKHRVPSVNKEDKSGIDMK